MCAERTNSTSLQTAFIKTKLFKYKVLVIESKLNADRKEVELVFSIHFIRNSRFFSTYELYWPIASPHTQI